MECGRSDTSSQMENYLMGKGTQGLGGVLTYLIVPREEKS
jgi:hypothetical protein